MTNKTSYRLVRRTVALWQRRKKRQQIGPLRTKLVTKQTRLRYNVAVNRFVDFCKDMRIEVPTVFEELDTLVVDCLEHMWEMGASQTDASNVVAGLQFFRPRLKRNLPAAWRIMKAWSKAEPPSRATPLTPLIVKALVMLWASREEWRLAAATLLGFHGLLRTGEIANLLCCDVAFDNDFGSAVVRLRETKSGKRLGVSESVTVTDRLVTRFLRNAMKNLGPTDRLLPCNANQYRGAFARAMGILGMSHLGFRPYSLRRGGATHLFVKTNNMSAVMVRGRWASSNTARLYVQEAVGELAEIQLTPGQRRTFEMAAERLIVIGRSLAV